MLFWIEKKVTVIVSITTLRKLTHCETLIRHLTADGRTVTLFGDNDEPLVKTRKINSQEHFTTEEAMFSIIQTQQQKIRRKPRQMEVKNE